jgi:hypothetical protein
LLLQSQLVLLRVCAFVEGRTKDTATTWSNWEGCNKENRHMHWHFRHSKCGLDDEFHWEEVSHLKSSERKMILMRIVTSHFQIHFVPFFAVICTMGSKASKPSVEKQENGKSATDSHPAKDNSNKMCIDCQKDRQVDLPSSTLGVDGAASTDPCFSEYQAVDQCMKERHGQVSSCKNEWNIFQMCFVTQKPQQ